MLTIRLLLALVVAGSVNPLLASGRVSHPGFAGDQERHSVSRSRVFTDLPLQFERNDGQTDRSVKFLARLGGTALYLTDSEAVLALQRKNSPPVALRMRPCGKTTRPVATPLELLPGKVNYSIGRDPGKWRHDIPTYRQVAYRDLYKGIDLIYYGAQGRLEYDFVVKPGGDPTQIGMRFEGARSMLVASNGDLVMDVGGNTIAWRKPTVFQQIAGRRVNVPAAFTIANAKTVRFAVAHYDASLPLVIDPVLAYGTYVDGTIGEWASGIAVDPTGAAYITGDTYSLDFPTTDGSFQRIYHNSIDSFKRGDAFVTKLDPSGSSLVYSTYVGGEGWEHAMDIAVDSTGCASIVGATKSQQFPVINYASEELGGGGSSAEDGFVARLSASGNTLTFSTYMGGLRDDRVTAIAVGKDGSIYVAGQSRGGLLTKGGIPVRTTFGTSAKEPQQSEQYPWTVFVAKFQQPQFTYQYETRLSGTKSDMSHGIAVDADGNAYVTGSTSSTDFPITSGAAISSFGEWGSSFVTKISPAGTALVYSTFLGDAVTTQGIAVDDAGSAYICGTTSSPTFQTTPGAFESQRSYRIRDDSNPLDYDVFVSKLNLQGSAFEYATRIAGTSDDIARRIAVDSFGCAWVTGDTKSPDYPTSPGALAVSSDPPGGAFATRLNADGSALLYSTYLGSYVDIGRGIAVGSNNSAYISGETHGRLPVTDDSFQPVKGNIFFSSAFAVELSGAEAPSAKSLNVASVEPAFVLNGQNATLTLTGAGFGSGTSVRFGGTAVPSSVVNPTHLTCTIPASLLTEAGSAYVTVSNYAGGVGETVAAPLSLLNPSPIVSSLSRTYVGAGAEGFQLTIHGTNFYHSKVYFRGETLTPGSVSPTDVAVWIPAYLIADSGATGISIINPAPGGGWSSPTIFRIVDAPIIASMSPPTVNAGADAFTLSITGSFFDSASVIMFAGTEMPTEHNADGTLSTIIPASTIAAAVEVPVVITSARPDVVSKSAVFRVVNARPMIASCAPTSVPVSVNTAELTILGTGFSAASRVIVDWGSYWAQLTVKSLSPNRLTVTLPPFDSGRVASLYIRNPAPDGGESNHVALTVTNPVPTITLLSPDTCTVGTFTVNYDRQHNVNTTDGIKTTITGSNFVSTSLAKFGNLPLRVEFVDATHLNVYGPVEYNSVAKVAPITVSNPAPNPGTSNPLPFTVRNPQPYLYTLAPTNAAAGTQSVILTLGGSFNASSRVLFGAKTLPTTLVSTETVTAALSASDLASGAVIQVTVSNPSPGGGKTVAKTFTISNPVPTVTAVTASQAASEAGTVTILVTGTGFVPTSQVKIGAKNLKVGFVSQTVLAAVVPVGMATAGGALIVSNPAPGGGASAAWTIPGVTVTTGGFVRVGRTTTISQTLTVANMSLAPVAGPVMVALDGLTSGVTVANKTSTVPGAGGVGTSPAIQVSVGAIQPGSSVTVTLSFANPTLKAITYTPRLIHN
ncbi:MAG TPA: IPT/TIG domain-containing protein [Capsulimonadaceae bacterium]|jgi:hypothetical protein